MALTKAQKDQVKRGQGWKCGARGCTKSIKSSGQIHHKNRNPNDNRIGNLVALCTSCHQKIKKQPRGFLSFLD